MPPQHYYTRIRGTVQGPYTDDEIQSMARRGQLGRMHHISEDGQTWQRAEAYPHFFMVITPQVSTLVPQQQPVHRQEQHQAPREEPPVSAAHANQVHSSQQRPSAEDGFVEPNSLETQQPFYYSQMGEQLGPTSYHNVLAMVRCGELTPFDLVWTEGMTEWMEIQSLPTLFPVVGTHSRPESDRRDRNPSEPTWSGMAIASLTLSLIPLFGLNCPLAIVFGAVGMQQIMKSDGRIKGFWLAVAGIIIGVISMLTWAIVLISMINNA
ncbi:MAG: hypothetical protein ACI9G1_001032 [Pirellulaceae bacterium]|jgi:hypothetical protein